MAVHLEFVLLGPPISHQQSTAQGRANLATWCARVAAEAQSKWAHPPLTGELKAVIINFYVGSHPSVDCANMLKPIVDSMENIVYVNDRQITQVEITHLKIGAPFSIVGVSKLIVDATHLGAQFVYVRLEDPVNPFPLPK